MQIIDAQIHLWNGDTAPPHHWRAPYTMERALEDMNLAGVDRAVNCPAIWDAEANDYADRAATAHPDRFATMGWFSLDGPAEESTVDQQMSRPGMLGLRFVLYAPQAEPLLSSDALDWLWSAANRLRLPVGLMVLPQHLHLVADIAARHPEMRLLIDHLAFGPFDKLPAADHLDALLPLAAADNIAVKATGVPGIAPDGYPFPSTHEVLRRIFDAFGAQRMFWGSDITRLPCSWTQCVSMFVDELAWLKGRDLELVMGRGLADWIGWA